MPANGRWDLIRRLKVKYEVHLVSDFLGGRFKEADQTRDPHAFQTSQKTGFLFGRDL